MTDETLLREIERRYNALTGKPCTASGFVVRKDSPIGHYLVHLHDTSIFYELKIKKLTREVANG